MAGGLKIGGGAGDTPDTGYGLHVEGDMKVFTGSQIQLDVTSTGIGFFGVAAVAQQTSSGPQTAGAVYTATEQTMLQEIYNAARAYGLLT
jgi:hypothetical protein